MQVSSFFLKYFYYVQTFFMCLKGFSLYIKINSFQNNINRLKQLNGSEPYPLPFTSVNGFFKKFTIYFVIMQSIIKNILPEYSFFRKNPCQIRA